MPVQIGQKRESDFSNPLGWLSDCHRRIENFLAVLLRISERDAGRPLDSDERTALENALAYFRNSAPKHTADEEQSLFPRLRASGQANSSLDRLAALEHDHRAAESDHAILDSLGVHWLSEGRLTAEQSRQMKQALERLSAMYARHIAVEDQELFPLAGRILQSEEIAAVGREMADRRGLQR